MLEPDWYIVNMYNILLIYNTTIYTIAKKCI